MLESELPWYRWPIWIGTLVFWIICLYMTHAPKPPDFTNTIHNDKIKHFLGYGALASMIYLSIWVKGIGKGKTVLIIIGLLAIYGALDERTQPWFGRDCDIHDWYADLCGVLVAVILWTIIRLLLSRRPGTAEAN